MSQAGLLFMRAQHFGSLYLPHASYPAEIYLRASQWITTQPDLSPWLPDLRKLDFLLRWDDSEFLLAVAGEQKLQMPMQDANGEWLAKIKKDFGVTLCTPGGPDVADYSDSPLAKQIFKDFGRKPGPVIGGRYTTAYDSDAKDLKERVWNGGAAILIEWARKAKVMSERSRLFLSHKGVDKPLVRAVAETLNMIGVKTWLDEKQLPAGRPLVRSLGEGVSDCCAAVFFVSSSFSDATFIKTEIDWALQAAATDPDFRIIPLVLLDHGGTGAMVPDALRYLSWKDARDFEVLKVILAALPSRLTEQICFVEA